VEDVVTGRPVELLDWQKELVEKFLKEPGRKWLMGGNRCGKSVMTAEIMRRVLEESRSSVRVTDSPAPLRGDTEADDPSS
jgi:hypothetical protein